MSNLDRALCERLQIPPRVEAGQTEHLGYGYSIVRKEPQYPALSTTGDGMVLLMGALQKANWRYVMRGETLHWVDLFPVLEPRHKGIAGTMCDSAPMALAMAAAAALGIEVADA